MRMWRIWMPTSNDYVWAAASTLRLLEKYWPEHPAVELTHFERSVAIAEGSKYILPIYLGEQAELSWTQAAIKYLENHAPDYFLILLDDYAITRRVSDVAFNHAFNHFTNDRQNTMPSLALTWQPCAPSIVGQFVEFPRWDYSFNTQAGLWRRDDMLRILKAIPPETSIRDVEIAGSQYFNNVMYSEGKRMVGWNIPRPANASGFVDETDKSNWIIPYNNLCRMGQRDARHTEWLAKELAT